MEVIEKVLSAALTLATSIMVVFVTRKLAKQDKKREERERQQEQREAMQAKERLLQTKMIGATLNTVEQTAIAVRDGRSNGELKAALAECKEAQKLYYEFLDEQAFKHIG